ncbi:MAG: DUF4093 domain-containing protein [Ruminococcus sp.]|nr:DUF4093 domain-containing protein [Ruminococcus sp.]
MLHIEQAIIVEGKYDKIKLSSIVDAVILVTDGFRIFKDEEKMSVIRYYAETTGVLILTDSDSAGFKIRNYLKGSVGGKVTNVYIPDVFGKERRKVHPSKEGKLGVEGIDPDVIIDAFRKAGVLFSERDEKKEKITRLDLYTDGLSGGENSSQKRRKLLKTIGLPELLTTTGMLEILNTMFTVEEYRELIEKIKKEEM